MYMDKEMKFENIVFSNLSGKEKNHQPSQIFLSLRAHSPFASRQRDQIPSAATTKCPVIENEEERTSTTTASATEAKKWQQENLTILLVSLFVESRLEIFHSLLLETDVDQEGPQAHQLLGVMH